MIMFKKLWFENVIKLKMKCTNLILFLAGFFVVVAYGKLYKYRVHILKETNGKKDCF